MTGLGKTAIYQAVNDGRLKATTFGRRRLINVESLRQLVEAE